MNYQDFVPIIMPALPKFGIFRLFSGENGSFSPLVDFPVC